ncbi:hypothetical protein HY642_04805 [Candidatus Woesearchaeota archaeon]|nr:hypothetical protein [Candidatus Woesearchaeota archaeon]
MVRFRAVNGVVNVDKEISELDKFTLEVVDIVRKHTDYVIISGYVSIFFGRSRGTEDVDIFIKPLAFGAFKAMYDEAVRAGFEWTIENAEALYHDYLNASTPVCLWRKDFPLLRVEMKLATKPSQAIAFQERIIVRFKGNELLMAGIEGQIAYKRYIAKSQKDLEDARHLELVFDGIDPQKIQEYRKLFEEEFHGR